MKNLLKWIGYFVYCIGVAIFFIYYLFPSDDAKNFAEYKLNRIDNRIKTDINGIKPCFPPGLQFSGVNILNKDEKVLFLNELKLYPHFFSVFRPLISVSYRIKAYDGIIKGTVDVAKKLKAKNMFVESNLSKININKIPEINNIKDFNIAGLVTGNIKFDKNEANKFYKVEIDIKIAQGKMWLAKPILGISELNNFIVTSIKAEAEIDNFNINIKSLSVKSEQSDISVSGAIVINNNDIKNSSLNLSGNIQPNPSFLSQLGKKLPINAIFKNKPSKDGFPFKLTGSPKRPSFSLI
ncbi:MAG: type II secretion system protein GspN [Desulfobacterales bacterium]|nr:type II secretion system protein GspN [Desulfobacterales bacterium]